MPKVKTYSLDEVKDEFIGKIGTKARDKFEEKLRLEILRRKKKLEEKERNLSQEHPNITLH